MIKSWKNKGLEKFFTKGTTKGIQAKHANVLIELLLTLNAAQKPADMNLPFYNFHPLKGEKKGFYAVKVNANWRLTFSFEGTNATLVNYEDYH